MPAHLMGAPCIAHHQVEEGRIVRRPHRVATSVLDGLGQKAAIAQILHAQGEALAARGVRAVGEQVAVVADGHRTQGEVIEAGCEGGFVENGLRRYRQRSAIHRPACPHAILRVRLEAPLVEPSAIAHRHGLIVGTLAALDLLEQRLGQFGHRGHRGLKVVVLGLEVREHGGVFHLWIGRVPQPVVGIFQRDAVMGGAVAASLGLRWAQRGCRGIVP